MSEFKPLTLHVDEEGVQRLVSTLLKSILDAMEFPPGRLALTEKEAADALGVGQHVLRDLRQAGQVSCSRVGKRNLYRREDLLAFLDRNAIDRNDGERR